MSQTQKLTTQTQELPQTIQARALIQPQSWDEKTRSFEAILSTEKDVDVWDWGKRDIVREILVVEGAEVPDQMPFLNNHNRYSLEGTLGSVRDIRKAGAQIIARFYFSSTADPKIVTKVQEGHLRDISIGYRIKESSVLNPGERKTVFGREYFCEGNRSMRIATSYLVYEGSLTVIGANDEAKIRSLDVPDDNKPVVTADPPKTEIKPQQQPETSLRSQQDAIEAALKAERERSAQITAVCREHEIDPTNYIERGLSIQSVKGEILDKIAERRKAGAVPVAHVEMGRDAMDKSRSFIEDCLLLRMGMPITGKDAVRHALFDLARIHLESRGEHGVRNMTREQVARLAVRSSYSHSTSDFPNILANSIAKRLGKSYEEAPSTFQYWCNIVEIPDFKQVSVNRLGEVPDLELIPEGGDYNEHTLGEEKEVYQLAKYGNIFRITWEALVNDDLNAFARIAKLQGNAAKRKVNQLAYAVLTANAALSDSVALFHATHGNLPTAAALGHDALSVARAAGRNQTGQDANVILNVVYKYLIVPAELETTAKQLRASEVVPGANQGHSKNTFQNAFEVIVEPILGLDDTNAWYMAADPSQIDTVDVAFLEGHREPFLEEVEGHKSDGRSYKVRMPAVAKAIDYRGLLKNVGA